VKPYQAVFWAIAFFILGLCNLSYAQSWQGGCGAPPQAPQGFYYICVCDSMGGNCQFVLVEKKKA
jgi:hypothetical protein